MHTHAITPVATATKLEKLRPKGSTPKPPPDLQIYLQPHVTWMSDGLF